MVKTSVISLEAGLPTAASEAPVKLYVILPEKMWSSRWMCVCLITFLAVLTCLQQYIEAGQTVDLVPSKWFFRRPCLQKESMCMGKPAMQ